MIQKKTAVLLYPYYSFYEMGVTLSILFQAEKTITVFGLSTTERVLSEEGFPALCEALVEDVQPEEYDSLLLTGCMQPFDSFMTDERYVQFVRRFDRADVVIGAISSSPLLLAKAGMLRDHKFRSGVPEEFMAENGMNPANSLEDGSYCVDGNLLTGRGSGFIDFGIQFGKMLGLTFEPGWYGVKAE